MKTCIFCNIVAGIHKPAWPIWEDGAHLAFLTPFPNTAGFSVVIPKTHRNSHVFGLGDDDFVSLMHASRAVQEVLARAFQVGRVAMIVEGMGVDHAHTKLVPLHGVPVDSPWSPRLSTRREFFDEYQGFVASHDGPPADAAELSMLQRRIRGVQTGTP